MTKRHLPDLESDVVRLRPLAEADLRLTLAWRNQDHVRRWFFHSDVITPAQHRAWYDSYAQRDDDFVYIIEEKAPVLRPVGQVALYHFDWERKRAEFGRLMIGEADAKGKGLARAATGLLLDEAFNDLGLSEVYLEVLADNVPALAVYEACGFQVTGRHQNVLSMARSRDD